MVSRYVIISGLLMLVSIDAAQAQAPDTLWTRRFGSGGSDYGSCVLQADDGGFIIAGSVQPLDSSADLYLMKTDIDGNLLWQRNFGGNLWDIGRIVRQTPEGGYIVVGETESFGGGQIEYPDIYLLKVDDAGNQEWHRTFGGPGMDIGYWIEPTADGGLIIVGELDNCADLLLAKTDSLGNSLWTKIYGSGCSAGYCVRQTGDGGYIIAGVDFDINGPYFGGYLLKVDSLGLEEWSRHYDSQDAKMIYCVQKTMDGGYILAGTIGDADNFDIFLKKVSLDGRDEWTRYFEIGHWDMAFCVDQTANGGYILAGCTDARIIGYSDAYILKTDANGEREWDLTLGGDRSDIARYIEQTEDGGFICCGYTQDDSVPSSQAIWLVRVSAEGVSVDEPEALSPNSFTLYPACPNPFNSSTTIRYYLPKSSPVKIDLYGVLGQHIATILEQKQSPGSHNVLWNGSGQASGVYYYKVLSSEGAKTGKLTLLK